MGEHAGRPEEGEGSHDRPRSSRLDGMPGEKEGDEQGGEGGGDEAETNEAIRRYLGEFRMVVAALGALLGFQLTIAFQGPFLEMAHWLRVTHLFGVAAVILAFVSLLMVPSIHRFASEVRNPEVFFRFARVGFHAGFAFLSFGVPLALFVQVSRILDDWRAGVWAGGATFALCVVAWWAVPAFAAARGGEDPRHQRKT